MKVNLFGVGEIECTPVEFAQLQELGALSNLRQEFGGDHSYVSSQLAKVQNGKFDETVKLNGFSETASARKTYVNGLKAELFFRKCTQAMARIMLAYLKHDGKISLTELLAETGMTDGRSLRKPNGALSDRIRAASSNRIREFHTAQQITNNGESRSERLYTISPTVLEFLKANELRIASLANVDY
jgi:hypothetical protein